MRMHNPPHPGSVLRDYLGSLSVTDAAPAPSCHSSDAVPRAERFGGDFSGDGAEAFRSPEHQSRAVDRNAVPI